MSTDPTLVLDFGSGFVKAGFAGNDAPSLVFPTVIGKFRHAKATTTGNSEPLIGEPALSNSDVVLKYPIVRSQVQIPKDFFHIVKYVFETLDLKGENCNVLISRPSDIDVSQLGLITEHFIEALHVQSISFVSSAALSLLSTGRVTGIVAECGYGITNVVPIFEFFGLEHARNTSKLGGQDVDAYLKSLLKKIGMGDNDNNAVQEVKEQLCFVKPSKSQNPTEPVPYELPSGTRLMIGEERHLGAEVLFNPKLNEIDAIGISEALRVSINRCDEYLKTDLYQNIVISGGSTMFPGMAERIEADLAPDVKKGLNVIAAPERKYGAWVGGSIFASTPVFEQFQIKKSDWETQKESIFRQKSFM